MANPEHLAILKQGVAAWNEWRRADLLADVDLSEVQLEREDLKEINLHQARLCGAKLSGANLQNSDLSFADLSHADLSRASLSYADLSGAELRNAYLTEALLLRATLGGADLTGAELESANLSWADLTLTTLTGAYLLGVRLKDANLGGACFKDAKLVSACLSGSDCHQTNFQGAVLSGADLRYARLLETNFEAADLSGCLVYGVSTWDLKLDNSVQTGLVITRDLDPLITVDDLEVAQFIYLLLDNRRFRDVIDTITTKVVLILGRFSPERKIILDRVRKELIAHDYIPVLFDFDKPVNRDLTETVRTLAFLARFIIADLTDTRSVAQELQAIAPDLAVPIQPIIEAGQSPWGMFVDFPSKYHWVLRVNEYRNVEDLLASLQERVIAPAEAKALQLRNR